MNRRDTLIALLALSALPMAPLAANAQQPRKVWRIGVLRPVFSSILGDGDPFNPFINAMGELGYARGRDYVLEHRFAEGDPNRFPAMAAELVALRVDLIIANGTPAAIAARNATREIPILFGGVLDPVRNGLVTSLGRPGANLTGVSEHSEMRGKLPDLLRQLVPRLLRIGLLHDAKGPLVLQAVADLEADCKRLGMRLISAPIGNPDEIVKAFARLKHQRVQGLVVSRVTSVDGAEKTIIELAAKNQLPTIFTTFSAVDDGGLISYGPDMDERFRRLAAYVDRIFKGAKPSDLPIEQPTTFKLMVNRKTAKALGLTIPQSLLIMADKVID